VDDLLAAARRHGFPISYDELVDCVETNDKQRFAFDVSGEMIRANQGHSVQVDLQLEQREPPDVLYHGTVERFLSSILEEGLVRGERHHVHLSKDEEKGVSNGTENRSKLVIRRVFSGATGPKSGCFALISVRTRRRSKLIRSGGRQLYALVAQLGG
jgi:putative RNA 2'-phosphotransferase